MNPQPRFVQGVFDFAGRGLDNPFPLDNAVYTVPKDRRAQLIYFRGGNSADQMMYVLVTRDGAPMRYFPIGARSDVHVALAVVEDLLTDTHLELFVGAAENVVGSVVLDIGFIEL